MRLTAVSLSPRDGSIGLIRFWCNITCYFKLSTFLLPVEYCGQQPVYLSPSTPQQIRRV